MIAEIMVYIDRIFNVETIERNGILADRTGKWVLKQTHLIIVKVDICEDIFHDRIENITRFKQLVDAVGLLSQYDILLGFGVLAIQMLGNGFINRQGKYQFVIVRTGFYLVDEPLFIGEKAAIYIDRLNVIDCHCNLLILVILIKSMVVQVCFLLGSNHTSHQFDRRIILSAVSVALTLYNNSFQCARVRLQLNIQEGCRAWLYGVFLALITYCTDGQYPTLMTVNRKLSTCISTHCNVVSLVGCTRI